MKLRATMGCETGARASGVQGQQGVAVVKGFAAAAAAAAAVVAAASAAAASTHFTFDYMLADVDAAAARLRRVLHSNYIFQSQVCTRHHLAVDAEYYLRTGNLF